MVANLKIRKHPRFRAKRQIIIFNGQDVIEGEAREITGTGIFLNSRRQLQKNETYRLAIRLSPKKTVFLKGKLMLSNQDDVRYKEAFQNRDISFIKVLDEDLQVLSDQIMGHL